MAQAWHGPTFDWQGRRYTFDRRPIPVILLHRLRRLFSIGLLGLVFAIALRQPTPPGMGIEAYRALCIFGLVTVLWVTQWIPLSITSLLVFALTAGLGVMKESAAYQAFGNTAVFFILGAFILGGVLMGSGLSTRLTLMTLRSVGNRPRALVTTIFLLGAFFSCLMSEHAVAAMIFPIVLEVALALKLPPGQSRYGAAMFFALAWGCIIGGITTPLGGGRVPLAVAMMEEFSGDRVTLKFLEYTYYNFPMVLLLLAVGWLLIRLIQGPEKPDLEPAERELSRRLLEMGRLSPRESAVGLVMLGTVLLWMFKGHDWGIANIAIAATGLLFVFRLTSWREIEKSVNWGIILMYGGAICLGAALNDSGAAEWFARTLLGGIESPRHLLVIFALSSILLTEFMSNSAVVAILMPIALTLCHSKGIDLRVALLTVVLPSNIGFMLPMGTPATAISFSSGFLKVRDSVRWALVLDLSGLGAFLLLLLVYWPAVGLLP